MKILNILLVTALLTGTAYAAGGKKADKDAWKKKVFTAEELEKYNGRDGQPAYAAVDGIVYDLTKSKYWRGGSHMKQHEAGADLTTDIKEKAPQGIHKGGKILNKMPKVGVTADYGKDKKPAGDGKAAEKPAEKKPAK